MSGGIEEPYIIAQLPRPIEDGKVVAAPVCSFTGSRKRKRHEVAVGVDGEGVNIYNVQDQSTLTSYPLPPQSYLAAPPCSVFCKRARPLPSERRTYVALRDGFRQSKLRLVSFTEEQGKVRTELKEPRLPVKREHPLRHGEIVSLEVLPTADNAPTQRSDHAVLISYKNGNVECLSSDLSTLRWHKAQTLDQGAEVEYAAVFDLDTARKGLFKHRDDVLALLNLTETATTDQFAPPILLQVIRSGQARNVRLYALRDVIGPSLQSTRSVMEELLSYELAYRYGDPRTVSYELHPSSGILYQRVDRRLTVWDLSAIVPRISYELGKKGVPRVSSFARLSSATLVAVTEDKIAVYDIKYGSTLSFLESSKYDDESRQGMTIISQYSDLGLVTAISDGKLVAFQVGDISDDGRRARTQEPLLMDVMGKGRFSHSTEGEHLSKKKQKQKQKWEAWKTETDQLVEQRAVDDLERRVAKDLHLSLPTNDEGEASRLVNGHSRSYTTKLWKLSPHSYDPQLIDAKKAIYLLGKLFRWSVPHSAGLGGDSKLQLSLVSRNIMQWLALAGYLTPSEIENALSKSARGSIRVRIAPGDILAAVQDADPTFALLCGLVSLPIHWELPEIVSGLQRLFWSLEDKDRIADDDGVEMMEGTGDDESRLQSEQAKADRQLEMVAQLLEVGVAERGQACRVLLTRLQAFPPKDVALTMHNMLTYEDLYFLISILRVELFDGKWALQYMENVDDEEVTPKDLGLAQEVKLDNNQAISSIARLFSCAVDAVGMNGWLVGLSANTVGAHEVIQNLRNEVAAATEGLYDASYIDVLLGEIGKTAGSLAERDRNEGQLGRRKRKHQEDDEVTLEDRLLPLGGRVRPRVAGAFGAQKGRSVKPALLAEERSRNVGKYTFEKIRI